MKMTASTEASSTSGNAKAESSADATLELTILSVDDHSSLPLLRKKSNLSVSVWVDPEHKQRIRLHDGSIIHLPLSIFSIQNHNSVLTIQILSPRLPFQSARPFATATVPISSLPLSGGPLNLRLCRPSGRITGTIQFSIRILWSLGSDPDLRLQPSAPPLPDEEEEVEEEPAEKISSNNNMEWRSFFVGLFSGAAAVALITAVKVKPH